MTQTFEQWKKENPIEHNHSPFSVAYDAWHARDAAHAEEIAAKSAEINALVDNCTEYTMQIAYRDDQLKELRSHLERAEELLMKNKSIAQCLTEYWNSEPDSAINACERAIELGNEMGLAIAEYFGGSSPQPQEPEKEESKPKYACPHDNYAPCPFCTPEREGTPTVHQMRVIFEDDDVLKGKSPDHDPYY